MTFPARCTRTLKKKPTEYLKQLYYDSMVFTPEGLRHLIAEVGVSQIVMGTDYPGLGSNIRPTHKGDGVCHPAHTEAVTPTWRGAPTVSLQHLRSRSRPLLRASYR